MEFTTKKEGYEIKADTVIIGKDLLITIVGGNSPHIGSVTCLTKTDQPQTIRYPSHDGRFHKDNVLAEIVGKIIQPQLVGSATITAGVHVDHITQKQIDVASSMAEELGQQILSWMGTIDYHYHDPIYYSKSENPQ